ncbi:DHA3 family macrolide efflux protein-like MFS transporter [Catalinimonas alkaloidigena]|uniref:MFS transporter n=1 Tax=Catalinimonas alkaloidigena TaxID=1075417 RepID=UPI0024071387|nr:MFS transporter [Catalinimonas alkaloidigena]MDF9800907.1 DHA3 family macrolide efflux protein-like MFS transporter [Catalinimonas alkaloidigena]
MTHSVLKKTINNKRALAILFTANGVSGFAQGITLLSIPWYFAQRDISSQFNLIYSLVTFATVFWGLWAGTVVDRFNRKHVFLLNNAVEGSIVLMIACYGIYLGDLSIPLIVSVFAVTMFGFYLHYPNLYAFAQEITPVEDYTKVTSYIEIVGQSTNVMAGAMAALLLEGLDWQAQWMLFEQPVEINLQIEAWALQEIFLLDGLTYLIAIVLIALIRYAPLEQRVIETGQLMKRLKTGFAYLKEHPMIMLFGICSHSIFVVMLVKLHALMPMYITNHLHEGGGVFGAMEVLYAIGALGAGLFVGNLFRTYSKIKAVVFLLGLATLSLALSAVTHSVLIFLLVGFMIGFANAGARVLRLSYLFKYVPNTVIGRVNSIFSIINVMMRVFFLAIFSIQYFGQEANIIYAYAIMALFTAASALILIINYKRLAYVY